MRFEWDDEKERINRAKHGFGFEITEEVFNDPSLVSSVDDLTDMEERWITIGSIPGKAPLAVVHTYREQNGEIVVRIISARKASRSERTRYERGT